MANKNRYVHHLVTDDGRELIDVESLAPKLNLCEEQVRRLTRQGKLPAVKIDGRWWYHWETIKGLKKYEPVVHTGKPLIEILGF